MAHEKSLAERANDIESHYEYWKKSLEEEYPLNIPEHPRSHTTPRVRPVPDLRFEQGYLKSIQPYVHVQRSSALEVSADEKGKGKAEGLGGGQEVVRRNLAEGEIIQIQWGRVAWITTRDQIISPLLQGMLRQLAGMFIPPLFSGLDTRCSTWWNSGATRRNRPHNEGYGVGWLRNWVSSLTAGSTGGTYQPSHAR